MITDYVADSLEDSALSLVLVHVPLTLALAVLARCAAACVSGVASDNDSDPPVLGAAGQLPAGDQGSTFPARRNITASFSARALALAAFPRSRPEQVVRRNRPGCSLRRQRAADATGGALASDPASDVAQSESVARPSAHAVHPPLPSAPNGPPQQPARNDQLIAAVIPIVSRQRA